MRRAPIRIRTFILGAILVLLLVPTLAGAVGWLIENDRQQAAVRQRLNSATDYLSSHGTEMGQPIVVEGFARLLGRLGLRAQVTLIANTPPAKVPLYTSPELVGSAREFKIRRATNPELSRLVPVVPTTLSTTWPHSQRQIPVGPSRKAAPSLTADLYYPPTSSATRALVALLTAVIVLFAGLAVVVWLTGRWMVTPLTRLSAEVDKVAGGHLTIAIPRSRIGEIENIAQAVEGMTTALGETAQRRTEADQARQFLVTGIAHDLRTPLFALRGHLQAIGSRLGNPSIHLERAEARADALEHLIGNLFAYTRDDYAQPAVQLQAIHVADLLREVTAGVEHAARLGDITFELDGDRATAITADRDRLKRALTNILDNAIRHSPPGATIQLSWITLESSGVLLTIDDHGPGIDSDLLPRIFEPGVRGNPAPGRDDTGAGLGLTIAKRLLEIQRATITIHNRPGGGAQVRLTLQRTPSEDLAEPSPTNGATSSR